MMDEFAVESHRRVAFAQDNGHYGEVEPIYGPDGNVYAADDGVRRDSSVEKLAKLKPVFDRTYGNVTPGNSSQITDGAAMLVLAAEEVVNEYGLDAARAHRRRELGRARPRGDGAGAGARDHADAAAQPPRRGTTSTARRSTRPSPRRCSGASAPGKATTTARSTSASTAPSGASTAASSTWTAAPSRSAIPSAPPARASCCTRSRCSSARAASAPSRRCASAAGRAAPCSSSGPGQSTRDA